MVPFIRTFGEVPKGEELIMKDDYKRIEVAINQGSFAKEYEVKAGDEIIIQIAKQSKRDNQFLSYIQKPKMKELWDNEYDQEWK